MEGRLRSVLNTRFMSKQKNIANFNEIRFWTWFLSEDKERIVFKVGGGDLEVQINPISARTEYGIRGDRIKLSPIAEPPELTFDEPEDLEEEHVDKEDFDGSS